jgi:hypothetical protein
MIEIIFEANAKPEDAARVVAFLSHHGFHVGKRLLKPDQPDENPNPTIHSYIPAYERDHHKFAQELTNFCRTFNPSPLMCIEVKTR